MKNINCRSEKIPSSDGSKNPWVVFAIVFLFSVNIALSEPPLKRIGPWTPAFSLDLISRYQMAGQFTLSSDGTQAAFTTVGRYFGHPLIPDFKYANNLRIVRIKDGSMKWLTSGLYPKTHPKFSPNGRYVTYESENDIWTVDTDTGIQKRLTLSPSGDEMAEWAPNGQTIAFVSARRGGSSDRMGRRIWIMSAEGELDNLHLVTDKPMNYQDVQWSPCGKWLLFTARTEGDHFYSSGLYVVAASGGEPSRRTPIDVAAYQNGRWSPDGKTIAFLSDKSGFFNLWIMDRDGRNIRPLTRDNYEHGWTHQDYQNNAMVWSPDGQRLLYFVNRQGNFDLWTIDVETGQTMKIGLEDGCYHPVGWVDRNNIAFVYENYYTPPDLHVHSRNSSSVNQVTHSSHVAFRKSAFGRLQRVSFKSRDGLLIHGYLLLPETIPEKRKIPGLVMLHTYNPGQFYNQFNPIFNYIVESGYAMLQLDQRGSTGYGREFLQKSVREWGGKQVDDVAAGAAFLGEQDFIDQDRLGVMGYSFGGYQTYWALIKTPDLFQAGVSLFGPADRRNRPQPSEGWAFHIGGPEKEFPELWEAASPAAHVERIKAPVLIVGGANDQIVHVGQTYRMAAELERAEKEYEMIMYPNESHGLIQPEHQLDSMKRIMSFLDRYLKR